YVLLIAAVKALGGGLLAAKLVGVVCGGAATAAVFGIALHVQGRPAAITAGLLHAAWPAGIAVTSVTGTDTPAAFFIAVAVFALVRWARPRPLLAAILFGARMGLAAYVRAVALPLAALGALSFRAAGASWRAAFARAALALVAAGLVLSPWAVRNRLR